MKSHKNTLSKGLKVLLIIIAFTFSTNMNASTSLFGWNWWGDWWGGKTHRHHSGCGHGGSSGGGTSIPIDGGLGILLVGAAAFGVKKLRENKNEKN